MRNVYRGILFSALCCVLFSACEISSDASDDVSTRRDALSANPCTAVALTTPAQAWTASVGVPIALAASATCPVGQTPEFEYWTKVAGAPNWSTLTGNPPNLGTEFVPAGSSYTPAVAESRCFAVAARAVGSTDVFQVFSSAACGTVAAATPPPPSAIRTVIIPVTGPEIGSPPNTVAAIISGTGSAAKVLTVPLGGDVGSTLSAIRVRVTDNVSAPVGMQLAVAGDSAQDLRVIAGVAFSNGTGTEQTITLSPSVGEAGSRRHFVLLNATSPAESHVWSMEADYR